MNPAARPTRLTERAKQLLAAVLSPGDIAVDATVGNGHDILFLARAVAPDGTVIGCDVQEAAIAATRARLARAGLEGIARLHLAGHERLADLVAREHQGHVAAVTFNLGYLPGGDKTLVTRPQTTLAALDAAAVLLRPGGLLSVLVYVGHPGGTAEHAAVRVWVEETSAEFTVHTERRGTPDSPVLYVLTRR